MLNNFKAWLFKDHITKLEDAQVRAMKHLSDEYEFLKKQQIDLKDAITQLEAERQSFQTEKEKFETDRMFGEHVKQAITSMGEPYLKISCEPTLQTGTYELMNTGDFVNRFNAALFNGTYELDWNDKFVANLIRSGYKHSDTDTDADIVDRWFQQVSMMYVNVFNRNQQQPDNNLYPFMKDM